MSTSTINCTPGAAIFPDGSASNLFPGIVTVKSSGTAPGVYFVHLLFDATNEEWCNWQFIMPSDYGSALTANVIYKMASATTGGVAWDVRVAAITSGDATDMDAKVFGSSNVGTGTVSGTAGRPLVISFALTNADSVAAGDIVVVRLARAVANGSDTATGDAEFVGMALTYTAV